MPFLSINLMFSSYLIVSSVSESFYEQEKVYYWKNEKNYQKYKERKKGYVRRHCTELFLKGEAKIGGEKSSDKSC